MDKNVIRDDMAFRKKCVSYGIDWSDFNVYKDIIILNSPKKDIFVLLDDNYNTIGIHKLEYGKSIEEYAKNYQNLYNYVDDNYGLDLPYPFQNFTIKQIVDIADRVTFDGYKVFVNDKLVIDEIMGKPDNIYISLLAYFKFLGMQIEQYFLNAYQMKMLGFDYPEVHSYVKNIVLNINECINMSIDKKTRPFPIDITDYLGLDRNNIDKWKTELHKIIQLLINEKGYKIVGGIEHYKKIETIDIDEKDLADLSLNLLKILEVSKDEIGKSKLLSEAIDLQSWLEQDLGETKKLKLTNPAVHN